MIKEFTYLLLFFVIALCIWITLRDVLGERKKKTNSLISDEEYARMMARIDELLKYESFSEEDLGELDELSAQVQCYEEMHFPIGPPDESHNSNSSKRPWYHK